MKQTLTWVPIKMWAFQTHQSERIVTCPEVIIGIQNVSEYSGNTTLAEFQKYRRKGLYAIVRASLL